MPRIIPPTDSALAAAAASLQCGEVIAFPTETVYGLGALINQPAAIRQIFAFKGRPANNPLIVHLGSAAAARQLAPVWPESADTLTRAFWPGPLALILPRAESVSHEITAGIETMALRVPDHPVAQQLLSLVDAPIAAPSANRSGHISPTTAQHVEQEFNNIPDLTILDGGPAPTGLESTVLDLTRNIPAILRPGSITRESIAQLIGPVQLTEAAAQSASPGTASRHYAPHTPLIMHSTDEIQSALNQSAGALVIITHSAFTVPPPHIHITMPDEPNAYAGSLYAKLREADQHQVTAILIERPPSDHPIWLAIHNRLRRAVTPS